MTENRRLDTDAGLPEVIAGVNRIFDVLFGNRGGRVYLREDDGIERDIRGGATVSTGNFAVKIRSGAGNHLDIRESGDAFSTLRVTNTIIEVRPQTFQFLLSGTRIIADMFSTPRANRLSFQSNTGSETILGIIPPTGQTTSGLSAFSNEDPDLAAVAAVLRATFAAAEIKSESPSGSYQPLRFYTNATNQWEIETSGNLVAKATGQRIRGDWSNATLTSRLAFQSSTTNGATGMIAIPNGSGTVASLALGNSSNLAAVQTANLIVNATEVNLSSSHIGASYLPLNLQNAGATQASLPAAGGFNVTAIDPPTADAQVTAGSQVKAFAYVTAGGGATLGQNYNIASVTRNGAGDFTVSWDRDFAAATYAVVVTIQDNAANLIARVNGQTTTSADIHIRDLAGVLTDPDAFSFIACGTLV